MLYTYVVLFVFAFGWHDLKRTSTVGDQERSIKHYKESRAGSKESQVRSTKQFNHNDESDMFWKRRLKPSALTRGK